MNSIWNKNIRLFSERFPALAQNLNLSEITEPDFDFWQVSPSKSGELTAKENSLNLHSAYNPVKEAENTVAAARTAEIWCAAFFSMGLGWTPLAWAKNHPDDTIIIAEPSLDHFFAALKYNNLEGLFRHKNLILALQAGIEDITGLIEKSAGFKHTAIIENKAQSNHAQDYFTALHSLIQRNKKKAQINSSTLEKFSKLWLKNSCRNIKEAAVMEGVNLYKDKCPDGLPALLVSAGPTLSAVLPHLKELKKLCIVIAVDTALRACLNEGVEPDFIILADPQYYAYRHIAGLKSSSSVLITESAAYPPVYRFECRKKVLCSSLFPLGQYFEKKLGQKGVLGAGGSVSTTAWDFARLAGFKTIYCAGLDLGYPKLQSHIRGSLFEEASHRTENRIKTSEKSLSCSLFAANSTVAQDYTGAPLFTDDKMKMFAWWFESKAQEYPYIKSWSLCEKSLAIPGFKYKPISDLLCEDEKINKRDEFFTASETQTSDSLLLKQKFDQVYTEFCSGLEQLYSLAKKGLKTADDIFCSSAPSQTKIAAASKLLQEIDNQILKSQFTETASLVFPGEDQLNKIFQETEFPQDQTKALFLRSKIIYSQLLGAIRQYQKYL